MYVVISAANCINIQGETGTSDATSRYVHLGACLPAHAGLLEALDEINRLAIVAADDEQGEVECWHSRLCRTRLVSDQVFADLLQVCARFISLLHLQQVVVLHLIGEKAWWQEVEAHALE